MLLNGFYDSVSLGSTNYQWNFGNGLTSNERVNSVFFEGAGTYLIRTIVSGFHAPARLLKSILKE